METINNIEAAQGKMSANNTTAQAMSRERMLAVFFTFCCIAAPILMGLASFDMGELKTYRSFGGVFNMYGMTIWIGAIVGMTWLLLSRAPRLALVTACLGIIGCVGGSNFVMAAMFRAKLMAAGVDQELLWFTGSNMSTSGLLVSGVMGTWFPVALIIFGIGLMRFKIIPSWLGIMLSVAGVCFPLGRIPGDPVFMHIADILLVAAMSILGWKYMRTAHKI